MDAAWLSQCSWSVIEKVIAAREIESRVQGKGYEKYSFVTFFPHFSEAEGVEYGTARGYNYTVQLLLCIRDIIKKVKILCRD